MKLGIYNYVTGMTTHAKPHSAATTRVVSAKTWLVTCCGFFVYLVFFFTSFISSRSAYTGRPVSTMPLPFDLLTFIGSHTWRVAWSILTPSLKIMRLSVLDLVLTSPKRHHWQCVCSHCACAVSRDPCTGTIFSHVLEITDLDLPIHYTTLSRYVDV